MDSNRRPLRCHPTEQSDQLLGPYAFQRRLMMVLRKGYDGWGLLTRSLWVRRLGRVGQS